jgi:hypothetical protein
MKGPDMKTLLSSLAFVVFGVLMASAAEGQEAAKVKVAVVRINAVTNSGNFYERMRLMSCDKGTLAAIKKVNAELKKVQKQVIDTEDEVKLGDLGRKTQFLTQKLNVLRQHAMNVNPNLDVQIMIRKFVVDTYKDKYQIIIQNDGNMPERFFLWKGGVQMDDITDDVAEKLREYMDKNIGE